MDFSISPELQDRLTTALEFVESELQPLEPLFLAGDFARLDSALVAKREAVKSMGLWAPNLPQSIGGAGFSLTELGLMSEVLGQSPLGHYSFGCQAPDAGNAELLLEFGSPAQHAQFLQPLAAGQVRSCFGMTEPAQAGSNPTTLAATAVRDGKDFVINGHKWFTSSADGAAFCIVMAVTNPDGSPHERASMILVPTDNPGWQFVRNIPIMGESGQGYYSHAEIRLVDCRVPASNLLGPQDKGFALAQHRLGPGRIHHCMRWIGICRRALNMMMDRALARELSPGEPLAEKQTIQNWIAESAAELEAARSLVLKAAWTAEHQGFKQARDEIGMIKFFAAEVLQRIVDRALQVHGALGMTEDTVLSWYYRHERAARIYDGPDEVHKAALARRMLRNRLAA